MYEGAFGLPVNLDGSSEYALRDLKYDFQASATCISTS
jgi:hypothetical protein